jgi:lantibiotic modifying enzyme
LARAAIAAIVRDIEARRIAPAHWPVHPLDDAGDTPPTGHQSVYLGTAGVLWALWTLQQQGAVTLQRDPADDLAAMDAAYQAAPDSGNVVPSLFIGEAGIQLVTWRLSASADAAAAADRLWAVASRNTDHPCHEPFWGAPGTLLATWHLWKATGEARWRALALAHIEAVWRNWLPDEANHGPLWTQDLPGSRPVQYLGGGHGYAGTVGSLLKTAELLDAPRREQLYDRCAHTLQAWARHDAQGAVNWPAGTYTPRADGPQVLMQWCHGAPGIVTALADFPSQRSPDIDALLLAAGHAIWQAGPLVKGPGLCHGTAGNAAALLVLYRRSSDTVWLDRARAFAMHAITQTAQARATHGQGRYSVWTGDPGVALVLWQCIQGTAGMPLLDLL